MIAWKYLNKHSATVTAIQDYNNMKYILENTDDNIKESYENIMKPKISSLSPVSEVGNVHRGEEKIVKTLDRIDVMRERYGQAVAFMAWFAPAWNNLSEKERLVLKEFYMGESLRSGATRRLATELQYSEANIEKLRKKSLNKFSVLLFGK